MNFQDDYVLQQNSGSSILVHDSWTLDAPGTMISRVLVLVLFYSKLIDYCDTASFVTAPPELIDSENDLLVKGYLGFNYIRDMRIILENVTWYEARDICQQLGFGLLENTTHTNFRQSIITGALNDTEQFSNLSMWTGYFRSNVTQDDWVIVGKENACYPTELQFDSRNTEYQCAINRYEVTGQEPKFEMRNCTDKLPFVCKDRTDEAINFTKYSEYDVLYTPGGASLILDWYLDLEGCLDKCKKSGFCVGFSYTVLTGECRWVRADFGVQALQYEIQHNGPLVSHYVKMGYDAIVIENSSYGDDLDEVEMYVDCESNNDPAGSTTPSSVSPETDSTSSTLLLQTDPETTTSAATTTTTSTTPGTSSSTTTLPLIFPGPTPPSSTSTTRISQTTTTLSPSSTTTVDPSTSTGKTTTMKTETSATATSDHTTTTAPPPPPTTTTTTQTAFTTSSTVTVTPKATKTSTTTTPRTSSSSSITSVSTPSSTTVGVTSSISASTSGSTTIAAVNTTECLCLCNTTDTYNNVTTEQIEEMIEVLIQNLTIKRKETYNYKITLECAEDDRPSARAMGVVAAIVMCFVFGPIVIADVFNIVKHFSFIHGLRRQI